jgi:hypothetical protein
VKPIRDSIPRPTGSGFRPATKSLAAATVTRPLAACALFAQLAAHAHLTFSHYYTIRASPTLGEKRYSLNSQSLFSHCTMFKASCCNLFSFKFISLELVLARMIGDALMCVRSVSFFFVHHVLHTVVFQAAAGVLIFGQQGFNILHVRQSAGTKGGR